MAHLGHRCVDGWKVQPSVQIRFEVYPKGKIDAQLEILKEMPLSRLVQQAETLPDVSIDADWVPRFQSLPTNDCVCVPRPETDPIVR